MANPIQGYFNSTSYTLDVNGFPIWNRAVGSEFMAKFAHTVLGNGAAAVTTGGFQVVKKSGMTVTVKPYFICKDGYMMYQTAETDITFTSSTSEHVFYIGARLDVANNHFTGDNVAAYTTFVSATDLAACKLTITANAVTITDGMIEDLRYNTAYCGQIDEYRERSLELITEAEKELAALQAAADNVTVETIGAIPNEAISSNLIINGGFDVWQRGTSQTSSGFGSDDRWSNVNDVSTKTHSRQTFTSGQTDVPNNPNYYSRTVVSSGGTAASRCIKYYKFEDVTKLSGKTVTLSFWAKSDSVRSVSVEFQQNFGAGGSTGINAIGVQKFTLSTLWAMYTATVTFPSVSGKTIGPNSMSTIVFWFDAGSDFNARTNGLGNQSGTFDIANVQLNYGSVALPFVPRSFADELRSCMVYYEKSYTYSVAPGTVNASGGLWFTTLMAVATGSGSRWLFGKHPMFLVTKRATPTITLYEYNGTAGQWAIPSGTALACSTIGVSPTGFTVTNNTGGTVTPTAGEAFGHWVADAEL